MSWRAARVFAIAIAVAAALDPSLTFNRPVPPLVGLVAADSVADRAVLARVAESLERDAVVVHGAVEGVAGVVIVGDALPPVAFAWQGVGFSVHDDASGARVRITRAHVPSRVPLEARVPVLVSVRVLQARGARVVLALHDEAGAVVDRTEISVASDSAELSAALALVPTAPGLRRASVSATIRGRDAVARADLATHVQDARRSVLFFDRRPSWMSTFVRRAVEQDPRYVVSSRIETSRGVSTDAGRPPPSLDDLVALEPFDAVVVGAPDALTARDVEGLERFLRRRGGGVVLLFDSIDGDAIRTLTRVSEWSRATAATPFRVRAGASDTAVLASQLAWPSQLPAGATPVAYSSPTPTDSAAPRPVIWRTAVGAGTMIVSGVLDAWRYRGDDQQGFTEFWVAQIADVAEAAVPALELSLAHPAVVPGERTELGIVLRDVANAVHAASRTVSATVSAQLAATADAAAESAAIPVWPAATLGHFVGRVEAPARPGVYRIAVRAGGAEASTHLVVADSVARPYRDERALISGWAASRGGSSHVASDLGALRRALLATVPTAQRQVEWFPMRSPWWIVPFVALLAAEWWARRRGASTEK